MSTDEIDYTLKRGDVVYNRTWGRGAVCVKIIDINWALQAAAVALNVITDGAIVVWPVAGLSRAPFPPVPIEVCAVDGCNQMAQPGVVNLCSAHKVEFSEFLRRKH